MLAASVEFINDVKDRAVASTFTEPAMLYCDVGNDWCTSPDVDVHGVSTFLAMLQVRVECPVHVLVVCTNHMFSRGVV